jgi:hypothetical protein
MIVEMCLDGWNSRTIWLFLADVRPPSFFSPDRSIRLQGEVV